EGRVFSSIDQMGRYAYGNQPRIAVWNMAQLATALIQLMDDKDAAVEQATAIVHAMPGQLQAAWLRRFGAKIGLAEPRAEDQQLIEELLALMQADGADFTNAFAALGTDTARDHFVDRDAYDAWEDKWRKLKPDADVMARANPQIIPRNHRIEEMIEAAVGGDMDPFKRLMDALSRPYDLPATFDDLRRPPTQDEVVPATFCGT
ncbi:MAG: protein adenylyltransferase SelO family protein, partial [Pseudomonadota bacterium]